MVHRQVIRSDRLVHDVLTPDEKPFLATCGCLVTAADRVPDIRHLHASSTCIPVVWKLLVLDFARTRHWFVASWYSVLRRPLQLPSADRTLDRSRLAIGVVVKDLTCETIRCRYVVDSSPGRLFNFIDSADRFLGVC